MSEFARIASNARQILIIQGSRIRDALLATPTQGAIAEACVHATLTVLGHPKRIFSLNGDARLMRRAFDQPGH